MNFLISTDLHDPGGILQVFDVFRISHKSQINISSFAYHNQRNHGEFWKFEKIPHKRLCLECVIHGNIQILKIVLFLEIFIEIPLKSK